MGELALLRWIRARLGRRDGRILVDSGDDAAVLRFGRSQVLFKTDSVIDGVHFDSRTARPEAIGHKAIARCLSDVAAMGCAPSFAVVAMMIPRQAREAYIRRVMLGLERTARAFRTSIVGGDIAGHRGKLALSVALLGETRGRPPVRRGGARVGDALLVTGPLGGSILGKHLRFTPRVREGLELNRRFKLHAMIDLSDGLATDLGHLCEESGVGAVVRESQLPIAPAARRLARKDGVSPLRHAISDGEDYELLFAIPRAEAPKVVRSGLGRVIGEIGPPPRRSGGGFGRAGGPAKAVSLLRRDGRLEPLPQSGWEHRFRR